MRGSMRTPAITELYQQKFLYQTHLKKLQKIREDRKNQLAYDSNRNSKNQDFRVSKSRSFAHRYNEQSSGIMESNKKFLKKLEKIRPSSRYSSFSTYEREDKQQASLTPFQKKRALETEKENSRIYVRVKSVSSDLSKDKMLKDYAKSIQIKSRITRFVNSNNKVTLKSQRSLSKSEDKKPNLASHYKAHDILKNRIETAKQSSRNTERSMSRGEKADFFTTQPLNVKKRIRRRAL